MDTNKPKICVPVIGGSPALFLENLKKAEGMSDLIELRVDYIKNLKIDDLAAIRQYNTKKSIFTCRKKEQGGQFSDGEKTRSDIINRALELEFDYIDIELSTLSQHRFDIGDTKLIASFHDFDKTPSLNELIKLIDRAKQHDPDIIKIAAQVNSEEDNRRLLKVLLSKKNDEELIIIGMGELGKKTRILSPLLGGFLTYASVDSQVTAPGQLSYLELSNLYKQFSNSII